MSQRCPRCDSNSVISNTEEFNVLTDGRLEIIAEQYYVCEKCHFEYVPCNIFDAISLEGKDNEQS